MDKVYIGYVSGVHGLRGDLKIKCRFESPEAVFQKDKVIYLNEESHKITNVKFYKGVYLTTIDDLKDINLVEKYIGFDVYAERTSLDLKNDYILDDLYGMSIVEKDKSYGKVSEILDNGAQKILVIDYEPKYMIPLVDSYIKRVNLDTHTIETDGVKGLIL